MRWVHVFSRALCRWTWLHVAAGVVLPAFIGIGLCYRAGWPPGGPWRPSPPPSGVVWNPPPVDVPIPPAVAFLPPPGAAWPPIAGQLPPDLRDTGEAIVPAAAPRDVNEPNVLSLLVLFAAFLVLAQCL